MADTTDTPVERADDFKSYYANSAVFLPSAFDLTITFARFDTKPDGVATIHQNCSVTVPWAQVKLAILNLQASLIGHEIEAGQRVKMRENTLPSRLAEPSPDAPQIAKRYHEEVNRLIDAFLEEQKRP